MTKKLLLVKSKSAYHRDIVEKDTERIYIFTDNCDRTSGAQKIDDNSEYSKRFGKKGLKYPKMTTALLRGLPNAYPVTTQKRYVPGSKSADGNWTDDDFEEFKKVIDDDFEHIKQAFAEKKPIEIVFPTNGVLNGPISKLTITRTPKLYEYIVKKEIELKNFCENENNG